MEGAVSIVGPTGTAMTGATCVSPLTSPHCDACADLGDNGTEFYAVTAVHLSTEPQPLAPSATTASRPHTTYHKESNARPSSTSAETVTDGYCRLRAGWSLRQNPGNCLPSV